MKGWFTRHKKDPESEYLHIPGKGVIKEVKVDMGTLYIVKDSGVWKSTRHGCRKIRKPYGILNRLRSLQDPSTNTLKMPGEQS